MTMMGTWSELIFSRLVTVSLRLRRVGDQEKIASRAVWECGCSRICAWGVTADEVVLGRGSGGGSH